MIEVCINSYMIAGGDYKTGKEKTCCHLKDAIDSYIFILQWRRGGVWHENGVPHYDWENLALNLHSAEKSMKWP